MKRAIDRFVMAMSFLTVLPVSKVDASWEDEIARSAVFFPLAGLVIGLIVAAVDALALHAFSPLCAAVIAVMTQFWVTGGMHVDGLMDTADGMLSGRSPDRILAIMHDGSVAPMGATLGMFIIILKIAFAASMSGTARIAALICAPAIGRLSMVLSFCSFPPATPERGMGRQLARKVGPGEFVAALLYTVALCFMAAGPRSLSAAACSLGVAFFVGWRVSSSIGGVTGDVYGAICEIAEVASLAAFAFRAA